MFIFAFGATGIASLLILMFIPGVGIIVVAMALILFGVFSHDLFKDPGNGGKKNSQKNILDITLGEIWDGAENRMQRNLCLCQIENKEVEIKELEKRLADCKKWAKPRLEYEIESARNSLKYQRIELKRLSE